MKSISMLPEYESQLRYFAYTAYTYETLFTVDFWVRYISANEKFTTISDEQLKSYITTRTLTGNYLLHWIATEFSMIYKYRLYEQKQLILLAKKVIKLNIYNIGAKNVFNMIPFDIVYSFCEKSKLKSEMLSVLKFKGMRPVNVPNYHGKYLEYFTKVIFLRFYSKQERLKELTIAFKQCEETFKNTFANLKNDIKKYNKKNPNNVQKVTNIGFHEPDVVPRDIVGRLDCILKRITFIADKIELQEITTNKNINLSDIEEKKLFEDVKETVKNIHK